jgi:hypothetical protein
LAYDLGVYGRSAGGDAAQGGDEVLDIDDSGFEEVADAVAVARVEQVCGIAAEWAGGLALTAVTGLGPLLRLALAGDGPGVAAWIAGALFVPSLALVLGIASRTTAPTAPSRSST